MLAMMAPAFAKSSAAMAGSMQSRSSRRRNSSVLLAQTSLSTSRALVKLPISSRTSSWLAFGT